MSDTPAVLETMQMPPRVAEQMGARYRIVRLWQADGAAALLR